MCAGAGGYINPNELFEPRWSNLSSGVDVWKKFSEPYYNQFGLSLSGFLINGDHPMTNASIRLFKDLSPTGVVAQHAPHTWLMVRTGLP